MENKNKILIIENENTQSVVLYELLEKEYNVFVIRSGAIAIKMIKIKKPDLILLDLNLPDMSGFDVLSYVKKYEEHIPVIITTADNETTSELKGLELGAADYIFKPYNEKITKLKIENQLKIYNYTLNLESMVEKRIQELKTAYDSAVIIMSILVNKRNGETGAHIGKVQKYMKSLIKNIDRKYVGNLSDKDLQSIIAFSPIHDVGKISILDSILSKPTALTPTEFETMKTHTIIGGEILRVSQELYGDNNDYFGFAIEMAECHHEKFDGTGYPAKLRGDEIPMSARMLILADVYDALTSPRVYKRAFSHKEACNILINGDGRIIPDNFDPHILDAFLRAEEEFEQICRTVHVK